VAPVFTEKGSAIFVIPHGTNRISAEHVLMLDDFTVDDLRRLVERFSVATKDSIEATGRALWDSFVGRLAQRIDGLHASRAVLLPQSGLGLLPVHAAWHETSGERHYLADDVTISYAPSAYALNVSGHRDPAAATSSAAVVAGVSHSRLFGDLPGVAVEIERVAALLGVDAVPEPQVTPTELLRSSGPTRYLHLACHGRFSWNSDPLDSALYLADDEPLTLADVIGRFDLSARLVTLSACESGVVEFERTPDEFFGLTAGFMQAGAAGVLSSLWRVDDLSTTLLMERFYSELVDDRGHPAVATGLPSPTAGPETTSRKILRPAAMSSARPQGPTCMTQTTATATPARPGRTANIALWTLQVLTAAVMVFASIPKVTLDPMAVTGFGMMGISPTGTVIIGCLEIAGAIAMFIPRLTGLAAICFIALMIGAVTTTVIFMPAVMAALPAVVLVVVAIIAYGRRRSTVELIGFVRPLAHR